MPTLKLTLTNRITFPTTGLPPELLQELREDFTHDNPERRQIGRLENAVKARPRDFRLRAQLSAAKKADEKIATHEERNDQFSAPRGGYGRIVEMLERAGFTTEIDDRRSDGDVLVGPVVGKLTHAPWSFQEDMLSAAIDGVTGIVLGETGCGKTQFAFMLALALQRPVLVLVHSRALLDDWVRRAQEEAGIAKGDIGILAGGERKIRPLTVGMVQTVAKHGAKYCSTFGAVIADEIEKFAAKTLFESANLFTARYRIGIGAQFKRKDGKEFLIRDLFGDVLLEVSRDQIGDKILDVEHRLIETDFAPDWYLKAAPGTRSYLFDRLIDACWTNKERNRLLARVAAAEVKAGNPVLAFSHRREHVRILEGDLRRELPELPADATGVMLGGASDKAEFDRCTAGFRANKLLFAGTTYMAASVGINLPSLPVGVLATPTHNNDSRIRQTQGRLRRTAVGKTSARLYIPWDWKCFGLAPLRKSLRFAPDKTFVLVEGRWVPGKERLAELERHEGTDIFTAER